MIRQTERLLGTRSGLRGQIAAYTVAAVLQGLALSVVIPAFRSLFANDLAAAALWTLLGGAISVTAGVITWAANNTGYAVGVERLGAGLMHRIGGRLPELPLGWFTGGTVGTLTTVMTSSVQNVLNLPSLIIQQLATAVITPATVVIVAAFVDPRLALAFLPMIPLAWWLYRVIDRVGARTDAMESAGEREVAERVVEFAHAQPVLRSSRQTLGGWSPLTSALEADRVATTDALRRKNLPTGAFTATVSLGFALVFSVAVLLALTGGVDTAALLGVLVLAVRFVEPLSVVGAYGSGVTTARSALGEIAAVIDVDSLPEPVEPIDPADASVEFRGVSFGYGEEHVLHDLSLRCEPGTTTALVGASGSGKTTMVRLVARFWDVSHGQVLIGGVDVRRISTPHLMGMISFVFQHVYLMNDTILANVRMGNPRASDEEVKAAARAARLDEVVQRLGGGWDTPVGEGGTLLSGGERQRVSIARAILKDAPIVLLDEATASLDAESEDAVTGALRTLTRGKTVLVIAHRLATIAHADQIAVLEDGRIADIGTHSELIGRAGVYSDFWADRQEATRWKVARRA